VLQHRDAFDDRVIDVRPFGELDRLGQCGVDGPEVGRERQEDFRGRVEGDDRQGPGLSRRAKARAAATAALIGAPRMLLLASIASTIPKRPFPAASAGSTLRLRTYWPFSSTVVRAAVSRIPLGRDRISDRCGNGAFAGVM
jgi:hypothetical protein